MRQIIPPIQPGLKSFAVPKRDISLSSGFGLESDHEISIDGVATLGRSSFPEREETDDEDNFEDDRDNGDEGGNFPSLSGPVIPVRSPIRQQSLGDQSWTPTISNRFSIPSAQSHRFSEPNVPPFRPPTELTPTSELDMLAHHQQLFPSVTTMAPPTLPSPPQYSPTYNLHATPTSLVKSSPGDIDPSLMFSVKVPPQTAQEPGPNKDENGDRTTEEILGEDDVRSSIIKLDIVPSGDAQILVDQ